MTLSLRNLYLYLFSFVGLWLIIFGTVSMINVGLKAFIFTQADRYQVYLGEQKPSGEAYTQQELDDRQDKELLRQRQQDISTALSMIMVGIPVYFYHWLTLSKENKKGK